MLITEELIEQGKSGEGGWNMEQLMILGAGWKPKSGWKARMIGKEIDQSAADLFLLLRGVRKRRERSDLVMQHCSPVALDLIAMRDKRQADRRARQKTRREIRKAAKGKKAGFVPTFAQAVKNDFLRTFEWRRVRMEALKKYGARCQCCGATPEKGAVMNVDHIKPRKVYPELALDVNNLQVLCDQFNHGKGNWDMTDWKKQEVKA